MRAARLMRVIVAVSVVVRIVVAVIMRGRVIRIRMHRLCIGAQRRVALAMRTGEVCVKFWGGWRHG